MTTCCGAECKTPFCPTCGKAVRQPSPLDGLLVYLRKTLKGLETELATWEATDYLAKFPEKREKRLQQRRAVIEKWKAWADALESLLAANPPA